jgi:hypothetical protein
MTNRGAFVLAGLGAASSALAQPQTQGTITYTLTVARATQTSGSWTNLPIVSPFGSVASIDGPNQGVLFRITMSVSEPIPGGPILLTWAPTIQAGSSGHGTFAGFWSGDLNLVGDGGAASASGNWSDGTAYALSVRTRLLTATAGNTGSAAPGGSRRTDIQPAQFNADAEGLNHGREYACFQGTWIPADLSARTVNWNVLLGSLGLLSSVAAEDNLYDDGYTLPVALRVETLFGPGVTVNFVPVPGATAILGLAAAGAFRRRRRCSGLAHAAGRQTARISPLESPG